MYCRVKLSSDQCVTNLCSYFLQPEGVNRLKPTQVNKYTVYIPPLFSTYQIWRWGGGWGGREETGQKWRALGARVRRADQQAHHHHPQSCLIIIIITIIVCQMMKVVRDVCGHMQLELQSARSDGGRTVRMRRWGWDIFRSSGCFAKRLKEK